MRVDVLRSALAVPRGLLDHVIGAGRCSVYSGNPVGARQPGYS